LGIAWQKAISYKKKVIFCLPDQALAAYMLLTVLVGYESRQTSKANIKE